MNILLPSVLLKSKGQCGDKQAHIYLNSYRCTQCTYFLWCKAKKSVCLNLTFSITPTHLNEPDESPAMFQLVSLTFRHILFESRLWSIWWSILPPSGKSEWWYWTHCLIIAHVFSLFGRKWGISWYGFIYVVNAQLCFYFSLYKMEIYL